MNRKKQRNPEGGANFRRCVLEAFEQATDQCSQALEIYARTCGASSGAAEKYLEMQARQWRFQQEKAEGRSMSAYRQIEEHFVLCSVKDARLFGYPISAKVVRAARLLNPNVRSTICLPHTPSLVAAETIDWMEQCLQSEDPINPVVRLLELLNTEVKEREPCARHIFEDARNQVFFLIELYTSGMTKLLDEMCASSQLITVAMAYGNFGQTSCQEFLERLRARRKQLSIWATVVEIIVAEYIPGVALSSELRALVEGVHAALAVTLESVKPALGSQPDRKGCIPEAREKLRRLCAHARATASLANCGRSAASIPATQLRLVECMKDSQVFNRLIISKAKLELRKFRNGGRHARTKATAA